MTWLRTQALQWLDSAIRSIWVGCQWLGGQAMAVLAFSLMLAIWLSVDPRKHK